MMLFIPMISFIVGCNQKQNDSSSPIVKDSLIIGLSTPITEAEKKYYAEACKKWYEAALLHRGFNGGILVAKKGNVVFEDYSGSPNLDNINDSITENTSFHIASVSKTFTAMAVLKLWQDGKINIDDELVKYFPAFNYPGVTIKTLLNHRSGLPNYVHFVETLHWNKDFFITNQDVLNFLINNKASLTDISKPDTHFTYCNTNYALLALLIEKIAGESYSNYLNNTFFKPLEMKHTYVFDTSMTKSVTNSFEWNERPIPFNYLDAVYGDKNIYATPRDLLTWDKALNSNKIFTATTLEAAYTPYSNEKKGARNYGLGWRMNIYPTGQKMIYHNGWWHGNNASFIRLISDSATIIVLGNKFNRNIYHAKDLAVIFGNNYKSDEDEEPNNAHKPKSIVKQQIPAKVVKKVAVKKGKARKGRITNPTKKRI